MNVKYPLLCIITAAFSLVSWNLIVQEIDAKDSKLYDNQFSEKHLVFPPKTDIVPSKPILGSKNIKHNSISGTTKIDAEVRTDFITKLKKIIPIIS